MSDTANLGLPCIEGSQAQKHVTHNEALRVLDTLVQLAVLDRDLTTPPGAPAEGQRWIVKSGATAAWSGHADAIAAWQDGAWQFSTPRIGWLAYVVDESALLTWSGSAWVAAIGAPSVLNNLTLLGVNATADAANPLSARLNNALFAAKTMADGGDGHLRYKLSKESAAKTLSFLFQDNFSGRAEIGLTGDDDFHCKVSPDGATWREGILINKSTGAVTFPNTAHAGRTILAANRTLYVRPDGSDSNDGTANDSAHALLTIQKAIDLFSTTIDLAGYAGTIAIADGTYTAPFAVTRPFVGGAVTISGNVTTPANVVIATTSATAITVTGPGSVLMLEGMELRTTTSGNALNASFAGQVIVGQAMRFGACAVTHMSADSGGIINITQNYSIVGSAGSTHWSAAWLGIINAQAAITITLAGTPSFSQFAFSRAGLVRVPGKTFSGSATGQRYLIDTNGVIFTNGGGATYLPGSSSGSGGTTSGGGLYS